MCFAVRGLHRRRGHDVIVHQHDLVGVVDAQDVGRHEVEVHRGVDLDHHDVSGPHGLLLRVVGKDLLDRVHAHGVGLAFRVTWWG
jgi:hypothetical protein